MNRFNLGSSDDSKKDNSDKEDKEYHVTSDGLIHTDREEAVREEQRINNEQ